MNLNCDFAVLFLNIFSILTAREANSLPYGLLSTFETVSCLTIRSRSEVPRRPG